MTKRHLTLSAAEGLRRFRLGKPLGEGADLQAFGATDTESGKPVVVKRPHPTLVSRRIHRDLESRTLLQAEMRTRIGNLSGLTQLHILTEPASFAWYFGDHLAEPYSVQVEERAGGIPLMGGVSDMVKGHPVALPLNLFVLHPHPKRIHPDYVNPAITALAIIERFYEEGYLADDLGPQNIFYSPGSARSKVIDLGALRKPSEATSRRPPFDLNDILFDIFRRYATPKPTPRDPAHFGLVREVPLSGSLERKAEAISREYAASDTRKTAPALNILSRIGQRDYIAPAQFRADLQAYLAASERADRDSVTEKAWRQARETLKSAYWKKYLFDAESELS